MKRRVVIGLVVIGSLTFWGTAAASADPPPTTIPAPPAPALATPAPAAPTTTPGTTAAPSTEPDSTGGGTFDAGDSAVTAPTGSGALDDMIPAPAIQGANQPTLAEKYPLSAYSFDTDLSGWHASDLPQMALNGIANVLLMLMTAIGAVAIRFFEWSFNTDLISPNAKGLDASIGDLADILYWPWLPTIVVLSGGWLLWNGVVKRHAATVVEGVMWVVLAGGVSAAFLLHPANAIRVVDSSSNQVSKSILAGAAKADVSSTSGTATFQGDSSEEELRKVGAQWWQTFVFNTWGQGEFGSSALTAKYGTQVLDTRTVLPGEDSSALTFSSNKADSYRQVRNKIYSENDATKRWFAGHNGQSRIAIALLGLLGVIAGALLFLMLGVCVLVAQAAVLMLAVFGPLFLVIGIHPGFGRRVFWSWVELLLGALLKKVLYAAALAVVLVTSADLMTSVSALGWFGAALSQILLFVALVVYRKPLMNVFSTAMGRSGASLAGARPRHHMRDIAAGVELAGDAASGAATAGALGAKAWWHGGQWIGGVSGDAVGSAAGMGLRAATAVGQRISDWSTSERPDLISSNPPASVEPLVLSAGVHDPDRYTEREGWRSPIIMGTSGWASEPGAPGPTDVRQWPQSVVSSFVDHEGTRWSTPAPLASNTEISRAEHEERQFQIGQYFFARERLTSWLDERDRTHEESLVR